MLSNTTLEANPGKYEMGFGSVVLHSIGDHNDEIVVGERHLLMDVALSVLRGNQDRMRAGERITWFHRDQLANDTDMGEV